MQKPPIDLDFGVTACVSWRADIYSQVQSVKNITEDVLRIYVNSNTFDGVCIDQFQLNFYSDVDGPITEQILWNANDIGNCPNIPSCATDSGNTCIYLDSDITFSCPKDEIVLGLPNNCNNVELIDAVTFDITPSTDKYCTEDSKCTGSDTRVCSVNNDHCVFTINL